MDVRNDDEALSAYRDIAARMDGSESAILVQEVIQGKRELAVGLSRDAQFGPSVMFGLGGIFTEILDDVSFRVAPLAKKDALQMMGEIKGHKILGAFRGMDAVDPHMLAHILVTLGKIGLENQRVQEIDINPLIISGSDPIAVDALVVLA